MCRTSAKTLKIIRNVIAFNQSEGAGQIANNNNNLSHNCLDGGLYVQSPKLMDIGLSIYCGNGYCCYLQPLQLL